MAQQPSGTTADQLRATAARIDALVTDAKSALDRLMQSTAPGRERSGPPSSRQEHDQESTAAAVAMLMENPVQSSPTNEFEDLLRTVGAEAPTFAATPTTASESATIDAEPVHAMHHATDPAPPDDGRGVFALAMVSMSMLVLAAFCGQHFAGVGIVGGANLLAWLVVVQQRRDARATALVAT